MKIAVQFPFGQCMLGQAWVPMTPDVPEEEVAWLNLAYNYESINVEAEHPTYRLAQKAVGELNGEIIEIFPEGETILPEPGVVV